MGKHYYFESFPEFFYNVEKMDGLREIWKLAEPSKIGAADFWSQLAKCRL